MFLELEKNSKVKRYGLVKHTFFFQNLWGAFFIRSGDIREAASWLDKKWVKRARIELVLADLFSIVISKNVGDHHLWATE